MHLIRSVFAPRTAADQNKQTTNKNFLKTEKTGVSPLRPTCLGWSTAFCGSVFTLLLGWFVTLVTGCLKIDAVCRTGSVVFKSGLALRTDSNTSCDNQATMCNIFKNNLFKNAETFLVMLVAAFHRTHPDMMVGVVERLVAVTLHFEERASSHRWMAQVHIRVQVAAWTSAYVGFAENTLYR